ncbi:MAG: beta-xylosidase, partial [Bacilli bacterium]|nr:beta-xylosidase [Bacilli bacterium]
MKRIRFDLNGEWIKKSENWRFGLGCDHAFQLHRKDLFEQLKYVHDELGFQYLRFHGIFDDDMLTYQRMSDYKPLSAIPHTKDIYEINFQQVGDVYHNVLDAGFKPFVEISFMPSALAKGKKTGLKYKNNICMPKSLSKWEHFVKEFIHYLIGEFGKEEVESWYFEIWNEPDLGIFFNGKQKDYFKLYVSTVKAIKEVDGNLRVGGPSTSACKWLKDFVDYCKANNVPCDFVSTHHYTGDAFGNMLTVKNALKMFPITKRNAKNG